MTHPVERILAEKRGRCPRCLAEVQDVDVASRRVRVMEHAADCPVADEWGSDEPLRAARRGHVAHCRAPV